MKYISELYDTYPGSDIYIIGTGASLRVFPLDFLKGKITIGLNMAWKVVPVKYSITIHPDLNIPEFMPNEKPHPEITWASGYFKTENGVVLKGVTSSDYLDYAFKNFYFFDYHGQPNTQPPHQPSDAGRILEWLRQPVANYLYNWSSISQAAANLAANMGAKNVILVGCDNCSLLNNHHSHNQHTRWKGVDPNLRYHQYYEGLAEVRTVLKERGVNLVSLTPFMSLANPEEDYERLCHELNQPRFIENKDISPKIANQNFYWNSFKSFVKCTLNKR